MPGNHTKTHMQVNLRILPTKIFFSFKVAQYVFHHFLYNIVLQNLSEVKIIATSTAIFS